jgi:hypothetical protein
LIGRLAALVAFTRPMLACNPHTDLAQLRHDNSVDTEAAVAVKRQEGRLRNKRQKKRCQFALAAFFLKRFKA